MIHQKKVNMINGRAKGHTFELRIAKELRELGYEAETSRLKNRALDDAGVDLVDNTPYYIQCKAVESLHKPSKVLKKMPTDKTPVVVHKRNNEPVLAYMFWDDFKQRMYDCDKKAKMVQGEIDYLRHLLEEVFHEHLQDLNSTLLQKIHTKLYKDEPIKLH